MNIDSFIKKITDSPDYILKSFKTNEIVFLKNQLFISKESILKKYGKFEVDKNGCPLFTNEQVFKKMPESTKKMFWAINNASVLIELGDRLNNDLNEEIKRMRAELTAQQITIVELQKQLKK